MYHDCISAQHENASIAVASKAAARTETPDETPGWTNREELLQSDEAAGAGGEGETSVPCNAPVPEKSPVKIIRPEQVDFDTNRVEAKSIVLARAKEKRLINKCVVAYVVATSLQKNVSKGMENWLMELEELLDRSSFYRRA